MQDIIIPSCMHMHIYVPVYMYNFMHIHIGSVAECFLCCQEKTVSSDRPCPTAPYEDLDSEYAVLTEATSLVPGGKPQDDDQVDIYVCNCDYVPDTKDELSLTEGMKCIVLERNDDGMVLAVVIFKRNIYVYIIHVHVDTVLL